jgi:hypothetical protein
MKALTNRVKYIALALVVAANVSATSASAAPITGIDLDPVVRVSPKLTDAGSAYWTVRVDGSGFSKNSDVYLQVIDLGSGDVSLSEMIHTSSAICLFGSCWGGGTFSYVGHPSKQTSQCSPGREVRAYDYGLHAWVNPITVGCQ